MQQPVRGVLGMRLAASATGSEAGRRHRIHLIIWACLVMASYSRHFEKSPQKAVNSIQVSSLPRFSYYQIRNRMASAVEILLMRNLNIKPRLFTASDGAALFSPTHIKRKQHRRICSDASSLRFSKYGIFLSSKND